MTHIVAENNVAYGFFSIFLLRILFSIFEVVMGFSQWRGEHMDPNPNQSCQGLFLIVLSPSQDQPGLNPCS